MAVRRGGFAASFPSAGFSYAGLKLFSFVSLRVRICGILALWLSKVVRAFWLRGFSAAVLKLRGSIPACRLSTRSFVPFRLRVFASAVVQHLGFVVV